LLKYFQGGGIKNRLGQANGVTALIKDAVIAFAMLKEAGRCGVGRDLRQQGR
jgi:hypothetical protein